MTDRLKKLFMDFKNESVSKEKARKLLKIHKKVKKNLYSSPKVFEIVSHKMIEDIMEGRDN